MDSTNKQPVVMVGAGHGSARAAHALRRAGHAGPITLIGQEPHLPYDRPPLSKAILAGTQELKDCELYDEVFYREHEIELRLGTRVVEVDRKRRQVIDGLGRAVGYGHLILATGAEPRRLGVPGGELPGVHYLRTADDAARLRAALAGGARRLAVVGAGFIGLEVAAAAAQMGCEVTVVEMAPRALARAVPAALADALTREHLRHGVSFRFGVAVREVIGEGRVTALALTDGSELACDGAVVGIGVVPSVHLARQAGLEVGDGIHVDAQQRTSDPRIYAIGDNCAFPNTLAGRRVRLESWKNAEDQAVNVAAAIVGGAAPAAPLPWFWSDQYELTLQVSGLPALGTRSVRRELGSGACLYLSVDDEGIPVGAGALGSLRLIAKEMRAAQTLIVRGLPVPDLDDERRSLRALAST